MLFSSSSLAVAVLPVALAGVVRSPKLQARDGSNPGMPYDDRTTKYCSFWIDSDGSETCQSVVDLWVPSLDAFRRWNPSITADCGGFETGKSYCVEVSGEPAQTSTTTTTISVSTPTPIQPGMVSNCNKFYFVKDGDRCPGIAASNGISEADLLKWNPKIGSTCTDLWKDVYVCVGAIGDSGTPTDPPNGIQTPSPLHPEMINVCAKFYKVRDGEGCVQVAAKNGITVDDLASWNGKIGTNCAGLYRDTYACVGIIQSYNFDDGTNMRWATVDGKYDASSKALVAAKSNGGKAVLKAPLRDFMYKARVKLDSSSGNAGVIVRSSSLSEGADAYRGYYIGISAENNGYVVIGRADNSWRELKRTSTAIKAGNTYTVKVLALGDSISVFVDDMGTPKFTIQDGTHRTGSIGTRVYATGASFDNMEIWPIVYEEFKKNMVGWVIYDGGFDARTGKMTCLDVPSGKTLMDPFFDDFILDAELSVSKTSAGDAGLVFRTTSAGKGTDAFHGYYVGLEPSRGRVVLGRADGRWTELKAASMSIDANKPYRVQIKAIGDAIDVYVGDLGRPKISVMDGKFKTGHVGVRVHNMGATADDLAIRRLY
ncbi:hypothetical protein QQS21_009659 [Conoideocrella luteorostrata]|uniref:LysM domain-containing protein n=1 Tax=Conoideocrella luteorostrata TaxID=1105319 RepID=A0AAJ0FQ60_9HYPO|nr:hypothetical protein QQS21_009659 [Conoideocrella luteorostrata]